MEGPAGTTIRVCPIAETIANLTKILHNYEIYGSLLKYVMVIG